MIRFEIDRYALVSRLLGAEPDEAGELRAETNLDEAPGVIELPITLKHRDVETRLVIEGSGGTSRAPDRTLVELVARAQLYLSRLTDGSQLSIGDVAKEFRAHRADISRILPLAFLSPKIVDAILAGCQPPDLTPSKLVRAIDLPTDGKRQAPILGM